MDNKEYRIGSKNEEKLVKVYLNKQDDFIQINVSDSSLFEKFASFISWLETNTEELKKWDQEHKDDETPILEIIQKKIGAYKEYCSRLDEVLGENTCRMYFRELYEANKDFVPDDECIYDLVEEIMPVFNELFAKKQDRLKLKYNRERKGAKRYRTKEELIEEYKGK